MPTPPIIRPVAKRSYGTGRLYVVADRGGRASWYGSWWVGGTRVKRRVGLKPTTGDADGLTRTQAERESGPESGHSPRPGRWPCSAASASRSASRTCRAGRCGELETLHRVGRPRLTTGSVAPIGRSNLCWSKPPSTAPEQYFAEAFAAVLAAAHDHPRLNNPEDLPPEGLGELDRFTLPVEMSPFPARRAEVRSERVVHQRLPRIAPEPPCDGLVEQADLLPQVPRFGEPLLDVGSVRVPPLHAGSASGYCRSASPPGLWPTNARRV
jgi:hypothetical protein